MDWKPLKFYGTGKTGPMVREGERCWTCGSGKVDHLEDLKGAYGEPGALYCPDKGNLLGLRGRRIKRLAESALGSGKPLSAAALKVIAEAGQFAQDCAELPEQKNRS